MYIRVAGVHYARGAGQFPRLNKKLERLRSAYQVPITHSDTFTGATVSDAITISDVVSETVADAVRRRNFARTMVLGILCCITALMLQTANFGPQRNLSEQRSTMLTRLIDASQRATPQPSTYDVES